MMNKIQKVLSMSNITNNNVNNVSLFKVLPRTQEWKDFLKMSVVYIEESWPSVFNDKTHSQFEIEYDNELTERLNQGSRGLFFAMNGNNRCGLVNYYIDEVNHEKCKSSKGLFIAEFYIEKDYRRKGLGRDLYNAVIKQAKEESDIDTIVVEVDKDKEDANFFWQKLDLALDNSGERNFYWKHIEK